MVKAEGGPIATDGLYGQWATVLPDPAPPPDIAHTTNTITLSESARNSSSFDDVHHSFELNCLALPLALLLYFCSTPSTFIGEQFILEARPSEFPTPTSKPFVFLCHRYPNPSRVVIKIAIRSPNDTLYWPHEMIHFNVQQNIYACGVQCIRVHQDRSPKFGQTVR